MTKHTYRRCEHCRYFQEDQWNTGYCQLNNMYVLKTFDCLEFVQRHTFDEGGGADSKKDDDSEV